jgi:hypothetical protein
LVALVPNTTTLTSPLQFRRDQDVYIMSSVELNCNTSFSTSMKWTIKGCSSICSIVIQLSQSVDMTSSELFIPAKTLSYGTYELQLIVTMTVSSNLTSSASAYININPSNIAVNLLPYGTSMITHGCHQSLTFNPGAYSVNPDTNTFNSSVSHYLYI